MLRIHLVLVVLWGGASLQAQNTLYDSREDQQFRTALELIQKEKYGAARQAFDAYIAHYPNSINTEEARYFRAFSALNLFHPDAEDIYKDFVKNYDNHPKASLAYYELGNFYFKKEDYKKSIEYLEQVPLAKLDPSYQLETRFKLAYGYFGRKQFDLALEKFNQIKTSPSNYSAAASYYAGYIEYRNGDYDQALVDLTRAEKSDSYTSLASYMIANVLYKQVKFDELLEYITKILQDRSSSNVNELYLLAGEAYYFKGDYKNAAINYNTYTEKSKRKLSPDIQYKLAYALYLAGDFEPALDKFKALASRDEEIGQFASYYQGDIYLQQGNLNYAVSSFNKASQDNYHQEIKEAASFKYSKALYDLGNYSQAIDGLEQFLSTYPTSQFINEAGDLLSEAYLYTNNYTQAIEHLEQIPNKSHRAQQAYQKVTYYKGTELFNKSKYSNAVQMFDKSLQYPIDHEIELLTNYWSAEAFSIGKKYPESIKSYQAVLNNPSLKQHEKYVRSRYGLGYAYYNTKEYNLALKQFSIFLQEYKKNKNRFYDDALIRTADCHYVLKDYHAAIEKYDLAISRKSHDQDYALLQKGTVLSIQGNKESARINFTTVINQFPKSRFADNAVYQRAQLDLETGNYQEAIDGFTDLINNYQKSNLIQFAYTKRALAYYNIKKYDQTLADYRTVLDQYMNHESAHDALIGLQETLNLLGRSAEFDSYFASYKSANPGSSSLANIEYESAVNLYLNEDYQNAINKFQKFIQSYPVDNHVYEARFYIAESYYRSKNDHEAIRYYQTVIQDNRITQVNRAMRRLGDLLFDQGKYQEAINSYQDLESAARTKKENYYAWSGLMESYFLENNYAQADHYAQLTLEQGGVNTNAINRSTLIRGKSSYMQNDLQSATDYFLSTLNTAQDENGAEAQYMIAKIQFEQGLFKQSNETLYDLNNSFGAYNYWLGKSFLLISNNYIGLDEIFQARATLNSIIENAPEEEFVEEAKRKLIELDKDEQQESLFDEDDQFEEIENQKP